MIVAAITEAIQKVNLTRLRLIMLEPQRLRITEIGWQKENHSKLVVTMLEHRTIVITEVFVQRYFVALWQSQLDLP